MSDTPIADRYRLTARERQVLALLITAAPSAEIAQKLQISEAYVKNCLWRIMKKTNTTSRLTLAMLALWRQPEFGAEMERYGKGEGGGASCGDRPLWGGEQ